MLVLTLRGDLTVEILGGGLSPKIFCKVSTNSKIKHMLDTTLLTY
jgi:hypothetical protein